MSSQNADWDAFLEETAADSDAVPTFALTPDESVENPEAHVQKVKFTKTPAFLWALTTGGFVTFVLLIYGVSSYLSSTRKVVASAPPSELGIFDEQPKKREILPRTPEAPGVPIAQQPVVKKTVPHRIARRNTERRTTPERVVYRNSSPARNYQPAPVYNAVRYNPPQDRTPKIEPIAPRPVAMRPVVPQPEPEVIGALYAPDSGEGPAIDTGTTEAPVAQSSNKAIEQALTLYDGNGSTMQANKLAKTIPVANASVQDTENTAPEQEQTPNTEPVVIPSVQPKAIVAMDDEPLTAAEYEKKFPYKASQERLMARLAIPSDTKIKGQIVGSLSWASQENFPTGKEIKIRINSDYKRDDKVIIPRGSVAIATSEEGTMGQYILANVTRIETPDGQSFSIPAGMLTASNSEGYIKASLKEPSQGGGVGRVLSSLGRSVLSIGAASVIPQGDSFGDRVIQNVAVEGVNAVDSAMDDGSSRRSGYSARRSQVPSFFVVKPKTTISLVANGDIELGQDQDQ